MTNPYKQSYKQEIVDNVSLAIFNCGLQSCTPGHQWGPGVRDHFLIHFVISGKGKYTCNGKSYSLKSGDMFLIKPSQVVNYIADENDPWEYYWVGFNGTYAQKAIANLPFKDNSPVYSPKDYDTCKEYLYQIYANSGNNMSNSTAMLGYLYLFLAKLIEESAMISPVQTITQSSYVIEAIKYIQFNYSSDISVDDIANAVGISRSHLYRVFVSNLGQSPIDYLTEYRINEACELIKNTSLSISQIAVSVGFFDQFYFSRVFKKIKKIPPSKYPSSLENQGEV
ncbi:MAG: AraC family transcriptional regulator [Oscillospiraceae bacterium]|nr:AraC family transcriptional regulator [Oscillospiraceae bacterium]